MILLILLLTGIWGAVWGASAAAQTPAPSGAPARSQGAASAISQSPSPAQAPATEAAAAAPAYAGSQACALCHEDIARDFRQNPHFPVDNGRSRNTHAKPWKGQGCESCHGPGQGHLEGGGDLKQIFVFKQAPASRVNEQCLACHAGDTTHAGRLMGSHNRNQIACTSCHSVHHSSARNLLGSASNALCQSCHLEVRAEFTRPYRHKLQEGAVSCVDCHNPHGDLPPHDLRRVSANDTTCVKCHGDKRGPFPFEHAPVRLDACTTCHEPHGSANPRMLVRHDQSLLCLECHTSSLSNASLATMGVTPPAFHDLRTARFRNCTACHSKIHGSYVNRDLLR